MRVLFISHCRYYREMTITNHFEFTLIRLPILYRMGRRRRIVNRHRGSCVHISRGIYSCRSSVISKHDIACIFSRPPGLCSRVRARIFYTQKPSFEGCNYAMSIHGANVYEAMDYRKFALNLRITRCSLHFMTGNGTWAKNVNSKGKSFSHTKKKGKKYEECISSSAKNI